MSFIFISYSRSDLTSISTILSTIKAASLEYWLDGSAILPTEEFNSRILAGLESCQWFLIVMTPNSAISEYVKDELHWALTNRNGRIIPIMLETCDPAKFHLRLLRIQYVDLTTSDPNGSDQFEKTLQLVRGSSGDGALLLNKQSVDSDLELISLLLTFISRNHQKHLRNLLAEPGSERSSYVGYRPVRHELRDLCNWGLLNRRPEVKIGELAKDGCRFILQDAVVLTDLGKRLAVHVS